MPVKELKRLLAVTIAGGITLAVLCAALSIRVKAQGNQEQVPDNPAVPVAPLQPILYSHKTHLALGLQCQTCHTNPDPGALMTFPATAACMNCHKSIAKNRPEIVKLAGFAKSGQPIPWVRVYKVTPGIQWTHRKHLQAGMKCETCHGQVAELPVMMMAKSVTAMGNCVHCHEMNNANTTCRTCHLWP
jgi:hypothetical protein